jgi:hypothetical protein
MERDELALTFYGPGPVPVPWATDCPVRFDAWLELAQATDQGLDRRVDLILEVNEEHGVRPILSNLAQRNVAVTASQALAIAGFVVARLTLSELVRAVVPMTNLYTVVRLAQEAGPALESAIEAPADSPDVALTFEAKERQRERNDQLNWFLTLLRTVAAEQLAGRVPPEQAAASAPKEVETILKQTVLEPQMTPPPAGAVGMVDRRRRYPIVSVTRNRSASAAVTRSRATVKADAAEQVFAVDCSSIVWAVVDSGIDAKHPAFTARAQPVLATVCS